MRFELEALSEMLRDVLVNFRLVEFDGQVGGPERPCLGEEGGISHSVANIFLLYNPGRYSPRGFKLESISVNGSMNSETVKVRVKGVPREFHGILLNEDVRNKLIVLDFRIFLQGFPVPVSQADSYLPLAEGHFYITPSRVPDCLEDRITVIDSGKTVTGTVLAGLPPALQAAHALKRFEPAEMETQSTVKMLWILDKEGIITPAVDHHGNGMLAVRYQDRVNQVIYMSAGQFLTMKEVEL